MLNWSTRPIEQSCLLGRLLGDVPLLRGLDVQVWNVLHQMETSGYGLETLTAADLAEFSATRHAGALRRSLETRAALRLVLSSVVSDACRPKDWVFERSPRGKPRLGMTCPQLEFSCSHSEAVSVIAVSRRNRLGIDIEPALVQADDQFLNAHFCSRERRRVRKARSAEERARFVSLAWTKKEAYGKLSGTGIAEQSHAECTEENLKVGWLPQRNDRQPTFYCWQIALSSGRYSIALAMAER